MSTLNSEQTSELRAHLSTQAIPQGPTDWKLGKESFIASSLALDPGASPAVNIVVMKSYDEATAFLNHLSRLLLAVGFGAVFVGSLLVYFTASTFTRPLEKLVDGVRALGGGDFRYPLHARGAGEVAELTNAFGSMRESLHQAQQRLLARRTAGHHRHHGKLHFPRLAASAHRGAGQRRVSGRRRSQSPATRRALPGNSDCGQPADRPDRFLAGAVAARRIVERHRRAHRADDQPRHRAGARASAISEDQRCH